MIRNIQGVSKIPYNRPLYDVSFKSRYNLYTSLATNDIPGIASYNSDYFDVINGLVNFKAQNVLQIKDYNQWANDFTTDTADELMCPNFMDPATQRRYKIGTPNILWQNGYTAFISVGNKTYEVPGLLLVLHDTRTDGTLIQKEIFYVGTSDNVSTDPYLPSRIYIRTVTRRTNGVELQGQFKNVMDIVNEVLFKSEYYDKPDAKFVGYSAEFMNKTLNDFFNEALSYVTTQLTPINNRINNIQNEVMTIDAKTAENDADIAIINNKIPSVASSQNQLADKAFVNSSINNMASFYITADAQGNGFETRQQLITTTTYYHGSEPRVPTQNDYAIVLQDETHDNKTARYSYQGTWGSGGEWTFQYVIASLSDGGGGTSFTQEQLDAINSGITAQKIADINTELTNKIPKTDIALNYNGWMNAPGDPAWRTKVPSISAVASADNSRKNDIANLRRIIDNTFCQVVQQLSGETGETIRTQLKFRLDGNDLYITTQ